MKKSITFILFFIFSFVSQIEIVAQDCSPGTAQAKISALKSTATFSLGGELWTDGSSGGLTFENNNGINLSVINNGGIWIGGSDPGGNIKLAASTYEFATGKTDFFPGPLDQFQGGTDAQTCENWNRFFRVTKEEINEHKNLYRKNSTGEINYTEDMIPEGVKNWPAIGNPYFNETFGFDLPDVNSGLADFQYGSFQHNGYDPLKGDFPELRIKNPSFLNFTPSCHIQPDEMLFWIINDAGGVHSETGAEPIQLEIQITAFVFNKIRGFEDAIFYNYNIIHRGVEDLYNVHFGIWADVYKCAGNEKFGCDSTRNLVYRYNQELITPVGEDECECLGTVACEKAPVFGTAFFESPFRLIPLLDDNGNLIIDTLGQDTLFQSQDIDMSSFSFYKNSAIGNPQLGTTDPQTPQEYFNYLQGRWRDGARLQYGSDGYNTGGRFAKYAFPSTPNDTTAGTWSMCTDNLSENDLRTIQSVGPMILKPGDKQEIIFGTFSADIERSECPDISPLQQKKDRIQLFFEDCFRGHVNVSEANSPLENISIHPNPGHNFSISGLPPKSNIRIFDLSGKPVIDLGQAENDVTTWSPSTDLPEGIYFVEVRSEEFGKRVLKWILTK